MTIEIYARHEHPSHNQFYTDAMKRGGKKKKKASKKEKEATNKNINKINIHIGKGKEDAMMEKLYSKFNAQMGGMGSSSSSMFPSTPSYYRLSAPNLNQAFPAPLNMAIPNNFVNPLQPIPPLRQGSSRGGSNDIVPPQPTSRFQPVNIHTYGGSSAFSPVEPEPHRPISAVMSSMTAGRPILNNPDLPRQRPTGRDNYVSPYQGQTDAPRSMWFPLRGQQPRTREEEQSEDEEVGSSKKKKSSMRPMSR